MASIILISTLISFIFPPLGCLVLWKRYVYFGDALAHASILGSVFTAIFGTPILVSSLINSMVFTFVIFKIRNKSGNNAAIGIISSIMISTALTLSYVFPGKFDLSGLLFGDIVNSDSKDIIVLLFVLTITVIFILTNYHKLIIIIVSKDIAHSRGINVKFIELAFLFILSFSILTTIKIVGALLVTSIIIIPSMISRLLSYSPSIMILLSVIFSQSMNILGIILSLYADMPFAPIIIVCGGLLYCVIFCLTSNITKIYN